MGMIKYMKKLWKNSKNVIVFVFFMSIITILTVKNKIVKDAIIESVNLFMYTLFPTLFPFFVLTNCAIALKIPLLLGKILRPIVEKWLHLEKEAGFILIMSLFTGFLAGAKYTEDMYQKGYITEESANKLLMFTHFGNPAFVIIFMGTSVLKDIRFGILLFLLQIGCNLLIARLIRPKKQITNKTKQIVNENQKNILGYAIFDSFQTLLMMLGSLTIFIIVENLVISLIPMTPFIQMITKLLLEITSGLSSLSILTIPLRLKIMIAAVALSFGGINIHMQVASYLENSKLKYKYFLKGRIYATLIQIILVFLLSSII